jgi:hypothetical protein
MKANEVFNALKALEGREVSVRPGMSWPGECFLCVEVARSVIAEDGRDIPLVVLKAGSGGGWTCRVRDIRRISDLPGKAVILTDRRHEDTGVFYDWPLKDGRDYPVYSPFPSHHTNPEEIKETVEELRSTRPWHRENCPPLPWTMRELVGSGWCNVYTGGYTEVLALVESVDGEPLLQNYEGVGWNLNGLGFWWADRYVIENWVRVDHLPPAVRFAWFAVELARWHEEENRKRRALACMDEDPGRVSCYRENRSMVLRAVKREQEEAKRVIEEMYAFARKHGLEVTTDVLNAGVEHLTGPVQLGLL